MELPRTPWDVLDELREMIAAGHGRLTPVPAFEVPIADDRFDRYFDAVEERSGVWPIDASDYVDPELLRDVEQLTLEGQRVQVVSSDSGRGADAFAAAIEIVGAVSDIGGATVVVVTLARLVREAYRRISSRLGRPPLVSLGAARHLAAADLIDRIGVEEAESVRFLGAGDVADQPPDLSYAGEDLFYVVLELGRDIYFYMVESDGVAHFVGSVTRNEYPRYRQS